MRPSLPPPPGSAKKLGGAPGDHGKGHSKKKHRGGHDDEAHGGHEELWLISYADLMTLLYGFFAILFSMSTLDAAKYSALSKGATEAFGGEYQLPTESIKREIVKEIQTTGLQNNDVEIKQNIEGIELQFTGQSLFQSGSADLNPEALRFIDKVFESLKKSKDGFTIRVEGHTDDIPINSPLFPSNWELSSARANRVVRRFEELGHPQQSLEGIGYGSSRPLVPNRNKDGSPITENMSKNRRVVIFLKRTEIGRSLASPDSAPKKDAAPKK